MPDWPMVTVLIVTYDRPDEIRRTIDSLRKHLQYDNLRWHIADDQSPGDYVKDIQNDYPDLDFTVTVTERKGWGVNANTALHFVESDYVFLNEDDYVAIRDLDIAAGVALMEAKTEVGLVRYDGVAAHDGLAFVLREAKETSVGRLDYLVVDRPASTHLNVYSHRPHLKHKRFHEKIGYYAEGLVLGETECDFAHRVKHALECPEVAILWDGVPRAFDHIGHSWKGSELDNPG